jgi:metal-responsive CopG/Arc/MetJ family transcriptional regulator
MDELRQDQRIQLVTSKRFVQQVDEWRRAQPELPSRSEAIRRLVEVGLATEAAAKPRHEKSETGK